MDAEGGGAYYVLFVITLADRIVHIAGVTTRPDEAWMLQVARNLTDEERGALATRRYLIVDWDAKYSERFRGMIEEAGIEVVRLPPRSANLNAYAERFVRSLNQECLGKMIFVGRASLRRAITEYMTHNHNERNHQGLENRLIPSGPRPAANHASIYRRQRLGGMLNCYYRAAEWTSRPRSWTHAVVGLTSWLCPTQLPGLGQSGLPFQSHRAGRSMLLPPSPRTSPCRKNQGCSVCA